MCWELNKVFDMVTCKFFLSKPGKCGRAEGAAQEKALDGLACARAVPVAFPARTVPVRVDGDAQGGGEGVGENQRSFQFISVIQFCK